VRQLTKDSRIEGEAERQTLGQKQTKDADLLGELRPTDFRR